nr:MAG TPA: hypothetical protein [Caudoviricetes sp.]
MYLLTLYISVVYTCIAILHKSILVYLVIMPIAIYTSIDYNKLIS